MLLIARQEPTEKARSKGRRCGDENGEMQKNEA
jgi:hypothetical protein